MGVESTSLDEKSSSFPYVSFVSHLSSGLSWAVKSIPAFLTQYLRNSPWDTPAATLEHRPGIVKDSFVQESAPGILVANIKSEPDHASSIEFTRIVQQGSENLSSGEPVLGFYPMNNNSNIPEAGGSIISEKRHKAYSKGKDAADKLIHLLNTGRQEATNHEHSSLSPVVSLGSTALVGKCSGDKQAEDQPHAFAYHEVEFQFKNAGFTSTQHMYFSAATLKAEDRIFSPQCEPIVDHVEILTGLCLFTNRILQRSLPEEGGIHPHILSDSKCTIYEMEQIARVSSAVADIASTVVLRAKESHSGRRLSVGINIDIPSFHYYHSVIEKLERGQCTPEETIQWMDAVDLRHDQTSSVLQRAVQHELSRRGISHHHECNIKVSSKTNLISSSIRHALRVGKTPHLDTIVDELNNQDEVWKAYYDLLTARQIPKDFRQLGYKMYIFQVIKPVLMMANKTIPGREDVYSGSKNKQEPRCMLISVDDETERKIYSHAQKLLKKIRNSKDIPVFPTLVEACSWRRVYTNNNKGESCLYLNEPSPEEPEVSRIEQLRNHSTGFEQIEIRQKLTPADIIRILYGAECAANLVNWCNEVGL